jgi:uncharacterized protein YecE (DUF72 family)
MAKRPPGRIRVGIAGWVFPPWRGSFYPKGLKQKDELRHVSHVLTTLEVNGTFYSMQKPATFAAWDDETPDDFVFALKGPRYITHMKRLNDCGPALANFLASGVLRLGAKLGPILWQLPPNMRFDAAKLEAFLQLLPRDRAAAATLASKHEDRMKGRAWLDPGPKGVLRHALEPRHESFADPACVALCRKHGVAIAVTDGIPEWPQFRELTSDFAYLRLHLSAEHEAGYDDEAIAAWLKQAKTWATSGKDVFVYFDAAGDETVKVNTPRNAATMLGMLGAAR